MKKNLLYLFLLIGLAVNAKHLTASDSNFENESENENTISTVNSCQLNVEIAQTLDIPSSQFFVLEHALNGTAPYTYFLDGELSPNGHVFYTSNLNKGIHTVTVQDVNGCTGSATFEVPTSPLRITTSSTIPNCIESGSITCIATGGLEPYTYTISTIEGSVLLTSSTGIFTNLNPGIYQIEVNDGIWDYSNTTVELIPPTPIAVTTTHTDVYCNGLNNGRITVIATGGAAPYTFSINGSAFQSTTVFSNLAAGTYTIIAKDTKGCTTVSTPVTIGEPTILTATATITNPTTCNENGTITVTASGGKAPYTYSFNSSVNYSSNNTFSISAAGEYFCYVKDYNGCSSELVIITEPLSPLSPTITATNINCKGDNSGRISIIAKGGAAPYMFSIDNGATFQSSSEFNNLSAGTYGVIVKDANGCMYTETTIIKEPVSALSATVSIENQTMTVTATGGTGIIHYAISPYLDQFFTSNTFGNLTPGTYELIAQDENGCYIFFHPIVHPSAPLLNGEKTLAIKFTPGQTLKDIIVDGQDIKWYSSKGTFVNKSKAPETTLPLDTELVDNTTYYASQTINGFESTERLAVTTKLSLSTVDYALPDFKFYPNPVKNILTISNTSAIDEVVFISIKGDVVLTKLVNSTDAAIDLSAFSKGIYFLKIKAEGTEKIIKLIKE